MFVYNKGYDIYFLFDPFSRHALQNCVIMENGLIIEDNGVLGHCCCSWLSPDQQH